jgi:diguanylate cyclase (GGDEF)-like protein
LEGQLRNLIEKLGLLKSSALVVAIAILFSFIGTYFLHQLLSLVGIMLDLEITLLIGVLVPTFTAPVVIIPILKLVLRINQLENSMRFLATYDTLTNLLNRRAFLEQATLLLNQRNNSDKNHCASILVVDLDHFKKINDKFGHSCGDAVLESFGVIVKQIMRKGDLAGRIGGEEFAFFLANTTQKDAAVFAQRLHKSIANALEVRDDCIVNYTISIGATCIDKSLDLAEALKRADKALYYVKDHGRNHTTFWEDLNIT